MDPPNQTGDEKDVNTKDSGSTSDSPTEKQGPAPTTKAAADNEHSQSPPPPPLYAVPSHTTSLEPPAGGDLHRSATSGTAGTATETYPEGGLEAWLVVLGAWLALVAGLGVMNTLGTLQAYLSAHQLARYDEGTIGWVFSLFTFVVFFLGLYIGPLFDKYGPRLLVLTGTVTLTASLVLVSISTGTFVNPSPTPILLPLGHKEKRVYIMADTPQNSGTSSYPSASSAASPAPSSSSPPSPPSATSSSAAGASPRASPPRAAPSAASSSP